MIVRNMHLLPGLLGKIAHLHPQCAHHDPTGYHSHKYDQLLFFQNQHMCKMFFRFIDQPPHWKDGYWLYCLEDSEMKDWYWFNLNQLIICTD